MQSFHLTKAQARHLAPPRHPLRTRLGWLALLTVVVSGAGVAAVAVDRAPSSHLGGSSTLAPKSSDPNADTSNADTSNADTSNADTSEGLVAGPTNPPTAALHWTAVLERLNTKRAHAWQHAKPDHLKRVFAAGSAVLAADQKALCDYVLRGLRVSGVHLQLGHVIVEDESDRWAKLTVVDRLQPVEIRDEVGQTRPLPRDEPTVHRVLLRKTAAGWRIASVTTPG